MNFNASRNVNQPGGIRKAKRVSDVASMGTPAPAPAFGPGPVFTQGPPPPYQDSIQVDSAPGFSQQQPPAQDFNFIGGFPAAAQMASPTQIGAMLQQPVVQDMALQYGGRLAEQSKAAVQRELHKFVPVSSLRYYFAVDTRYVINKLLLILFPFTHKEWTVKFDQNTPVQPRYDINAPDLYIPYMGYVTYVLLAAFIMGLQNRFTPEKIGMQASSALAYMIFEIIMYYVTLYVTATNSNLKMLDLLAFSSYKYTIMISSLLAGLVLSSLGYYCVLIYTSFALSYFLVKTLRVQVLSGASPPEQSGYGVQEANPYTDNWNKPTGSGGTKRRLYFLLFVAVTQPVLSWWLTYHLVITPTITPAVITPS